MAVQIKLSVFQGKTIAIDGPAGSGKSTTAKLLANRLGFTYLDTGAMYRAVALFALRNNVSLEDGNALAQIAKTIKIEFQNDSDNGQLVFLNGEDVTEAIRTPEATYGASAVAVFSEVRSELVNQQQEMGAKGNMVVEGRDTTSVVFPRADLKIYLDADIRIRAERRFLDAIHQGEESSIDTQVELLKARDKNDSERKASPLMKVNDAVVVDTTSLSIEGQIETIIKIAKKRFTVV
ncbi:MAG: (d)CMP kinase [candidate division Zixibacteria bacterium]|nr:(d)CMP kinase [candidate division Zixibacteria bacterium]